VSNWEEIWSKAGTRQLWSIPDLRVVELVNEWKSEPQIHRVLDIGCGLGRHAFVLAQAGLEVYGLDHSETAIENCREWFQSTGLTGTFWCGELDDIPYPDGYFDAVLAFNSIYHDTGEKVEQILSLISDKTKVDGVCFITIPSQNNRLYGQGEEIAPHTYVSPGMYDQLFDGGGERGVTHHFCSKEEIPALFQNFHIDSLVEEEFQIASLNRLTNHVSWRRVKQSYFWQITVRKGSHASRSIIESKIAG